MDETPEVPVAAAEEEATLQAPAAPVKALPIPTDDKLNLKILQNKVLQLQIQYQNVGRNLQGMQKQLDDYAQALYQQQGLDFKDYILDLEQLAFVPRPQPPAVVNTPKE